MEIEAVTALIKSQGSICCLAGAGISIDNPTCSLSGFQVIELVLKALTPDEHTFQRLKKIAFPESFPSEVILRFEHLILVIQSAIDPTLSFLYELFDEKKPNYIHYLMADLVKNGNTVLTTNFDMNIENALLGDHYLYKIAGLDHWAPESENERQGFLGKLHGSLYSDGKPSYFSLQATVRAILTGQADEVYESVKPKESKDFFKDVLRNKLLLVIGYSGFDDFDLVPLIESTKSEQTIIWVKHAETERIDVQTFDSINRRYELAGKFYDKSDFLLYQAVRTGSREKEKVIQISGKTERILTAIFGFEKIVERQGRKYATPTLPDYAINVRWLATANIFLQIGDYLNARNCFIQAAATTPVEDLLNKHRGHYNAAECSLSIRDYPTALGQIEQAAQYSSRLNDPYRNILTMYMRARILYLTGTKKDLSSAYNQFSDVAEFIEDSIKDTINKINSERRFSADLINILRNHRELFASCEYNRITILAELSDWKDVEISYLEYLISYCRDHSLFKYELFTESDLLYLKKKRSLVSDQEVREIANGILKRVGSVDPQIQTIIINKLNRIKRN